MKSTCQISKGSLGSLNAHGRYGFLSQDCILDQWEEQGSKLCHSPWNEDQAGFHRERHPLLRRPGLLPPFILTSVTQIVRYCVGGAGVLGWPCRLGSTGLLLQIIDDKGNSLPFNTEGNIGIRMKPTKPIGLFMGYEDNPVKTAKVECGDFYNSGDRATMDEEGYIWFLGRNDDIINASGLYTWLPLPLSLHSGSALQVVKAFIVLTPEFLSHDRDQLTKELQQHVKSVPAPCAQHGASSCPQHSYGHRLGRPSSLKESSPGSQSCSAEMVPVYKKFTHGLWMWTDIRR
ncbi:acyl-coenzyme A synthetase ACSM3, mitochondrial-like isoform X10 [Mirounga angustirostris]|uniref:acyl-coenzyme A synthetase ACSM3, mitochondrial-like isoform X10 n=1 Tax=Mirounga angustirostris TaxID=9716 RepID=UPI00313E5B2E